MSVSLSSLYTAIRLGIGDESETGVDQEYTDASLNNYIASAVTFYSRYLPHVIKQTQTTVADQSEYALPLAATGVRDVKWRNTPYTIPSNATPTLNLEWQDNALLAVRDQMIANYDRVTRTAWAVINYPNSYTGGLYLRLFPAPVNSDDDIEIWYTTDHSLVGSSYPTIPAEHAEHISNLAIALLLRREARIMLRQPDINAGQGLRVGSAPAQRLIMEAEFIEQQVTDRISIPVGGRG